MSKVASQSSSSLWQISDWPSLNSLNSDLKTEVCVIGAGIAGLTTAYLLSKEGRKVTLLDASGPGRGETGNTTAHLASAIDDHFSELEKLFGEEGAFLAADSHRSAIDGIEAICHQERISCSFERLDGYLFDRPQSTSDFIEKEFAAAQRAGFKDCEILDQAPISSIRTGPCLRFPNQAQIHPLRYLQGLLRAYLKQGGEIYIASEVSHIEEGKQANIYTLQGHTIQAQAVVVATNTPINNRLTMHTKQHPYRTYVIALEIDKSAVAKGLFWDTLDPYHYVRLQEYDAAHTFLIVGGEDHKVGQDEHPEVHFTRLEFWARQYFPEARAVVNRWSGQVLEPVDGLAYIGHNPGSQGNVYIATGDSGNGMTHGTIAGILLTDLIQGRSNPWASLYSPSRKNMHLASVSEFVRENINVAAQYRDYFTPGDVENLSDIPVGHGAIMRHGLQKVAVYRQEEDSFHSLSAVCPHLGGIVRWNGLEKTWDCPCHGSRFDYEGNVVNGPSISNLKKVELSFKSNKEQEEENITPEVDAADTPATFDQVAPGHRPPHQRPDSEHRPRL